MGGTAGKNIPKMEGEKNPKKSILNALNKYKSKPIFQEVPLSSSIGAQPFRLFLIIVYQMPKHADTYGALFRGLQMTFNFVVDEY